MQKNKLTGWQLCFLTLQTQMGISALSMPSTIAVKAGQDAWISMIIGGLAVQIVVMIYIWLLLRCGSTSYFEFLTIVFGRILGKVFLLLTILYILFILILVTVSYQQLITDWINIYTPNWVVILMLLIPSVYLAIENISLIARFSVLISFSIPIFLILVLFVYASPQFYYLLPIGSEGLKAIIEGVVPAIAALSGFEMILFISHFLKNEKRSSELRKGMVGTALVTLFYIFLIISVQLFFYIDEIKIVPYPVLYIMKALSLMIIDRIDILFLTFWIIISTAVCINYLFIAGIGIQALIKLKSHKYSVVISTFIVFIISIFIETKSEINLLQDQLFIMLLTFTIIIPIFTLLVSLLRKKVGDR
ncbi:GerAB/ArcD/ProY family transporter [Jeotgalibacillus haloalkalitolerans]|uniref:GerAB/ArcD/ProY family transporter n=1 Tax=Jeotgalibacillus haloalkalitolerans TaxID=3104292 RepID=A0ABU5KLC1_9BACL|nr:GerAB/ArcD/ProY family transporter [Jeotgalibacillus sp. HH7-29]MDZ5711932.1 GerAB/ArcD/ProY family transporter [Jeotgalibacillus sp. HH7-29]